MQATGVVSLTECMVRALACLTACLPATCSKMMWTCRLEQLGRLLRGRRLGKLFGCIYDCKITLSTAHLVA